MRESNQRQTFRRRVCIKALLLRERQSPLPCTLVDVSETGARLIVGDSAEVPQRFTIVMTARGVPQRTCQLVWRGTRQIGVRFEADKYRHEGWNCMLQPGQSLQDAFDTFAFEDEPVLN